ncbi:hypothetical protein GCM10027299_37390 [Larkinella ripae]
MKTFNFVQLDVTEMTDQELIETLGGTNNQPSNNSGDCHSWCGSQSSDSSRKSSFLGIGLSLDIDLSLDFESSRSSRSWSC